MGLLENQQRAASLESKTGNWRRDQMRLEDRLARQGILLGGFQEDGIGSQEAEGLMAGADELFASESPEDSISAPAEGSISENGDEIDSPKVVVSILEWGQLHESMLLCELQDGGWGGAHLHALAVRLRSNPDELQSVRDQVDDLTWNARRMQKILEMETIKNRGFSWDRLESVALGKMTEMVLTKKLTLGEHLAIARVANTATRRGSSAEGDHMNKNQGGGNQVQVNVYGQPVESASAELPGPGSLGTIKLTLSNRSVKQLTEGRVIDHDGSFTDSIEMLEAKDVPQLSKLTDELE